MRMKYSRVTHFFFLRGSVRYAPDARAGTARAKLSAAARTVFSKEGTLAVSIYK